MLFDPINTMLQYLVRRYSIALPKYSTVFLKGVFGRGDLFHNFQRKTSLKDTKLLAKVRLCKPSLQ